ncbi:MAG: hypothetical protein PVH68_18890, partial [Armatimonadota bacterium]
MDELDPVAELGPEYDPHGRTRRGRIGVFGVGLDAYWPQFPELKGKLLAHQGMFVDRLREAGFDVVSGGLCDTSQRAFDVGGALRGEGCDLVFCYVATYAPAAVAVPVAQRAGAPVVLVG